MAMSNREIRGNFDYWSQWFPRAEAIELSIQGGRDAKFYEFTTGVRAGREITGREVLANQRRFVENVRTTDGRFKNTKLKTVSRRDSEGNVRRVRVKNINEAMKRVASRRRDSLVKARVADTASFRTWLRIHFPDSP